MVTIQEVEKAFYLSQLSLTDGNLFELRRKFYQTELSSTNTNLQELEIAWLKLGGATSNNITDAWKQFLIISGFTGVNIQEEKIKYYIANT